MPQYILLIYPPAERAPRPEMISRWQEFNDTVVADGVLVTSGRLQTLDSATTVRIRDGETLISDGPFAETKEYLAGFYLVECADLDQALRYAALMPVGDDGTVEVRPLMFPAGTTADEMRAQAEA
jgi:hypothetical protein